MIKCWHYKLQKITHWTSVAQLNEQNTLLRSNRVIVWLDDFYVLVIFTSRFKCSSGALLYRLISSSLISIVKHCYKLTQLWPSMLLLYSKAALNYLI